MKPEELVAALGVFFFLGILGLMAYPALRDFWKNLGHYFSHS